MPAGLVYGVHITVKALVVRMEAHLIDDGHSHEEAA